MKLVVAIALVALVVVAGSVGSTHASFTASVAVAGNGFRVATVEDTFDVQPGGAVRVGTTTPVATGSGQNLALDLGFVPSARAFTTVFTVRNRTSSTQTAVLGTAALPAQVAGVAFASTGTTTAVLAAGASTAVTVTTSPTTAGRGSGLLRLRIGGSTWLYRDYPLSLDAAPEAPVSTSVAARAAGRLALTWSASATTNVAGYEIWRANGGGAAARVATDVTGTSWTDTATTDGVAYTYTVRAVSSGTPSFTSLDGPGAAATADATPPAVPTSVSIPGGWVNLANRAAVTVQVVLPSGSAASDVVTITAGGVSKTVAAPAGAGTVSTTFDLTGSPDGSVSMSASATDVAGNVSGSRSGSAAKDTVAPGAPTATYTDSKTNVADVISGAAESGATVRATQTAPSASGPYSATATGGAYSVSVAPGGKDVTVTYQLTATDSAGNTSSTTTLTALSSR